MTRKAAQWTLLLAGALLLSACATLTRLAYSNAAMAYSNVGPMLSWMVDDYVDLDGGQREWVRERIERAMSWHRREELPEYRRFLERVLDETGEPFTAAELAERWGELRAHYRRTVERVLPDLADFLLRLQPAQVAQMERKFESDNRKMVRESLKGSPAERAARRVKRFGRHLESWLGSLTDEQRELIRVYYQDIPDLVEERLGDRRFRQAETLALVRARPSHEEMVAGLRRLFLDTGSWRRPEYTRKLQERERRFFEMLAQLSATLQPAQRAHLQKRIRGYMGDINTLLAEAG